VKGAKIMRRTLLVLAMAGLVSLTMANMADAQRRGGGGGRVYGGGGYYAPYNYGGHYYGDRYYSGYGTGLAFGLGYGLGGLGNNYYSPGYYSAYNYAPYYTPSYSMPYYGEATVQTPLIQSQSFYSGPPANQAVTVRVQVPAANAQVWFGDSATTQQGVERVFQSPPLVPGKTYQYAIKAQWMENGKAVTRERQVDVTAGQTVDVDFRDRGFYRENAPATDAVTPANNTNPPLAIPLNPTNPNRPPNP
jgi:uncharacterized protein (TIGR03000 family)